MSHACLLVALGPQEIEESGGLHQAVTKQMAPFDENGEGFRDGSRWDWWMIGGRWEGFLHGENTIRRDALQKGTLESTFAFLRHHRWHETERMGFFGGSAPTECEIVATDAGVSPPSRCVRRDKASGASTITWNGREDGSWGKKFWGRFIRDLPPETILVVVDYHV